MKKMRFEVLGIWIGSPAKLPSLQREGIFRFLFNLVKHLSLHHSLKFEIWCQQINLPQVRKHFSPLLERADFSGRMIFCTEMNTPRRSPGDAGKYRNALLFASAALVHYLKTAVFSLKEVMLKFKRLLLLVAVPLLLSVIALLLHAGFLARLPFWGFLPPLIFLLLFAIRGFRDFLELLLIRSWDFFKRISDFLPRVANQYSAADCFLIQNIDMANAWKIDRLKVINLHDLFASEFAPLFTKSGRTRRLLFQGRKATRYAERLARGGSFFISNSEHIRRTHALALIPGLGDENTGVIFLPAIIPEGIRQKIPEREMVQAAFEIRGDYVFYPTHIRPYKNILTLLKAFKIVLDSGHALSLVLTGNLADDAGCSAFVQQHDLRDQIILTGEISEVQMYSLYRYAVLVAVPTFAESSFPWQAMEAMAMEVPVIVSHIPVVEEWLHHHDLEADRCGLLMFESCDENALGQMIIHVLANRAQVLSEQKTLRDTLLTYDWHQLSDRYFGLFKRLVEREN
jgi:glycosyltransferase involved in cell wall biosynthesis